MSCDNYFVVLLTTSVLNNCLPGTWGSGGEWHGGQWLIPEVQTDKTGIVCDWQNNRDLRYINASLSAPTSPHPPYLSLLLHSVEWHSQPVL